MRREGADTQIGGITWRIKDIIDEILSLDTGREMEPDRRVYGSNFSGWIFCQMNVTFSSTLSINYTKFYYRMIKTKIFSDISFQIRVIIYLQINSKLAICLSICPQNTYGLNAERMSL